MNTSKGIYYPKQQQVKRSAVEEFASKLVRVVDNLPNALSQETREHLKNVYLLSTLSLCCALLGVGLRSILDFGELLTRFCGFAFIAVLFGLLMLEHTPMFETRRFRFLLTFLCLAPMLSWSFFESLGFQNLGTIELNLFLAILIVFACYLLSSLHAETMQFLHLCAIFLSISICLFLTGFIAPYVHFLRPSMLWTVLALSSCFLVYDTQFIVEKRQRLDNDYIWHSFMLFADFLAIFFYLLMVLKGKALELNNWLRRKMMDHGKVKTK